MSDKKLIEWLNAPCLSEDLLSLPWDSEKLYMPIKTTREKFRIMENQFGAVVEQIDLSVFAINTYLKDTLFTATVKFIVYHEDFKRGQKTFCGTASFYISQYDGGWSFAQIAESIATTRAFSKDFAQFGKGLNEELETLKDLRSPSGKSKSGAVKNSMRNAI